MHKDFDEELESWMADTLPQAAAWSIAKPHAIHDCALEWR